MVFQVLKGWLGHVGTAPRGKEGFKPLLQVLIAALVAVAPIYFLLSRNDILGYVLVIMFLALMAYFVYSGVRNGSKVQLHRYIAMLILFFANIFFWSLFEQAGSSLNFFARDYVNMPVLPFFGQMDFTAFQSANPIFIILLAPIFAWLWP